MRLCFDVRIAAVGSGGFFCRIFSNFRPSHIPPAPRQYAVGTRGGAASACTPGTPASPARCSPASRPSALRPANTPTAPPCSPSGQRDSRRVRREPAWHDAL